MNKFECEKIKLQGSNLIEASAGTGKTYSIAILVLRLLIEEKLPIEKILLVTFTEAAAAELKERTAKFIRIALKEMEVASEADAVDSTIWKIVSKAVKESNKVGVSEILNTALLNIDQASITTIHSFCQKTLTEFAFETNQMFGGELLTNIDDIINQCVYEYWRTNIAVIDYELQNIFPEKFIQFISKAVKYKLAGQEFNSECIDISRFKEYQQIDNEISLYFNGKKSEFIERVKLYKASGFKEKTQEKALNIIENCIDFNQLFLSKLTHKLADIFPNEVDYCIEQNNKRSILKQGMLSEIISKSIKPIVLEIDNTLNRNNYLTFDALIKNLHNVKDNKELIKVLRDKYSAVFIDEFQDTDKLQYEIFESVFQSNKETILFYIGDPKQSIYAFRKADLNTYFRAKKQISHSGKVWTMNTNYRSTSSYVNSMNQFFMPSEKFPTFCYSNLEIMYHHVDASEKNQGKSGIVKNNVEFLPPLQIRKDYKNKPTIQSDVVNLVVKLLDGNHKVGGEEIVPSDIGILVRFNFEGRAIKKELEKRGVPAVVVDDTSIFKSEEAHDLNLILNSILNPTKSNIDKALLTNLIGKTSSELSNIDHDEVLVLFKDYERQWIKSGIFYMLNKLISDFGIEDRWTKDNKFGYRILSNTYQLIEILQKVSTSRNYTPNKLVAFLHRAVNDAEKPEDEYTQRIERDETAVKIATIHKSKGLEYNIVLLPNLDFEEEEKYEFSSFRSQQEEYYFTLNPIRNSVHKELFEIQQKQENRRLIYVALTRACYNCFIFSREGESSINDFISELGKQIIDSKVIDILNSKENPIEIMDYSDKTKKLTFKQRSFPINKPSDQNWHKLSYSFVAASHKSHQAENNRQYDPGYDNFIFKELKKGTNAGDLLHNIFEFLDFTNNKEWDTVIDISLNKHTRSMAEVYKPWLPEMIEHVLNAPIKVSNETIFLNEISNEFKLNEFEFDFNVDNEFEIEELRELFPQEDPRFVYTGHGNVKGMFTGFMDMFFEHNGQYFILDWKSNFLGDSIENYEPNKLNDAMNDGNYHLQYLIYTLALKRYLQSKIPDFNYEKHFGGVIYIFLRGVRKDMSNGIFITKPEESIIIKLEQTMKLNN